MFGYMETPYTVEKQVDIQTPSGVTRRLELRRSNNRGRPGVVPYIALEGTDASGKRVLDHIYRYESHELLERDWTLLTEDAVAEADLGCVEVIVDHITGYRKDGGVAMY
jgi:hypothetical protein